MMLAPCCTSTYLSRSAFIPTELAVGKGPSARHEQKLLQLHVLVSHCFSRGRIPVILQRLDKNLVNYTGIQR